MTQCEMILQHMKDNDGGITPLDALERYGCFRLSARISDLRKQGHNIVSVRETKNHKTYCRYKLGE